MSTATATATETKVHLDPGKRHDFVLLFDVTDGNPNGDPDAGNLPRVDPETMQGLVSDGCIKRRVRDFVDIMHGDQARYKIYVQSKGIALNALHRRAYEAEEIVSTGSKQKREDVERVRAWMCKNFYDIRTFGAVMTTGVNAGQVRGPVQITFARSVSPIVPLDVAITRVAITDEDAADVVIGADGKTTGKTTEMGCKTLVPYGLYKGYGFFTPHFAEQTGFDSADLAILWEALQHMWEFDRSASRGMMSPRGLLIFSHDDPLGNAPVHKLFDRIQIKQRPGVAAPRAFGDFVVEVSSGGLPEGVTLTRLGE